MTYNSGIIAILLDFSESLSALAATMKGKYSIGIAERVKKLEYINTRISEKNKEFESPHKIMWDQEQPEVKQADDEDLTKPRITIQPALRHEPILIINGDWNEIVLRSKLIQLINTHRNQIRNYHLLSQISFKREDNTASVLDLVLMINDKVFYFKCKSAMNSTYYKRFNDHQLQMKIKAGHSFIIIPEKDINIAIQFNTRCQMQALASIDLESQLKEYIFEKILKL